MKRDLKICYTKLEEICNSLTTFQTAMEEIESAMEKFGGSMAINSGRSIDKLEEKNGIIKIDLVRCKEEIQDLYTIFHAFIQEMTGRINAVNRDATMRVDRDDIYWNLSSIHTACENMEYLKRQVYSTSSPAFWLSEEEKEAKNRILEYNYDAMEEYRSKFGRTYGYIQEELDEMDRIYQKRITEFEDLDDSYGRKAGILNDKYSNGWERAWNFVVGTVEVISQFANGVTGAVIGMADGLVTTLGGLVYLLAAGSAVIVTAPFGYTPDWAKNYLESVGNTTKAILEDPVVLIESIVQESCDVVEEQGIAYAAGCIAVEIGFSIVGAKGFKAADNVDDATKIASKADDLPGSGVVKSVDEVIGGGSKALNNANKMEALLDGRPELTCSIRDKLLTTVQDSELSKIVNELYRPGATVGDGGTASILIEEFSRGSSKHLIKATERLKQLKKMANSGKLGLNDLDAVEALIDDLEYAINLYK